MALKNDGEYKYGLNGGIVIPSLILFEKAEQRLANKKSAIEEMQNEYELLQRQAFETYTEHIFYWQLSKSLIKEAQKWLMCIKKDKAPDGTKLDKRKKYTEKERFVFLKETLEDMLKIETIDISEIYDYNFGQANEIEFLYAGEKWTLEVPNIQGISLDRYKTYGPDVFKLSLRCCKDHVRYLVGSTYVEEELADLMKKGIEKYATQE